MAQLCVWDHFTRIGRGLRNRSNCNYCGKVCECEIDALWTHLNIQCQEYPYRLGDKRQYVSDDDSIDNESSRNIEAKFDLDEEAALRARIQGLRVALAKMIFIDALPFRGYCHYMDPDFELPSRIEVARDVMNLYLDEKKKLKSLLTGNSQSTDVWTSS